MQYNKNVRESNLRWRTTYYGATDADTSLDGNNLIRSALSGSESWSGQDFFVIDSITGVVSTSGSELIDELAEDDVFDREQKDVYVLTVIAYNPNLPALADFAELTIILNDVNDVNPAFSLPEYVASVSEGAPSNTLVTTLFARDGDLRFDLNANLTFMVSGPEANLFHLIGQSPSEECVHGMCDLWWPVQVLKIGSLDREMQNSITLTVTVSDLGTPARSNTAEITVTVLDENTQAP